MMRKSAWLLSGAFVAFAVPAYAQDQEVPQTNATPTEDASSDEAAVDNSAVEQQPVDSSDIVVTATRRNQALSDVPLAVSAVTAQQLELTGANDIRQLQQVSPSLLVTSTQSEGGASTARIRGIGTVGDNPGLESSVGVFIDGVYRSRTGVGLTELGPLDRIEILRGPQGTLFGRNTSAGLISIITARPRFEPEAFGQLDVGNYDMRRVEAGITGGLSETIAARIDGVYMRRDGFVTDLISGRDVNDRNRWLVRGQLLFQPSNDFSLRLIGDYSKRDEECCAAPYIEPSDFVAGSGRQPSTFVPILTGGLLGGIVPPDPFDRDVVISPGRSYRQDVKDWGLSAEAVYDFGAAELTSITAYRDNDLVRGTDVDYSNVDIVYRPDDGSVFNRFKTFSQEARLQGEALGGRLDWLVGGYYANERLNSADSLRYGADYGAFTNCLTAASFARSFAAVNPAFAALIDPNSPTCFNATLAGIAEPFVPLAQRTAFQAFTRRGVFAAPIFTNSGLQNLVRALVPGAGGFVLADTGFYDDFRQRSNNLAFFTHNIFDITDQLALTVGARYTTETKRLDAELTDNVLACTALSGTALAGAPCVIPSVPGGVLDLDGKRKESKLSGTVVLSYKPTDNLLTYVSYSRGYKAGGFNLDRSALTRQTILDAAGQPIAGAICLSAATPGCARAASAEDLEFKPETNDAVELGAKFNGRAIDVNVAVFHQLFKNFQLNTFNGVNFIVENINSCDEDLNGADTDNNPFNGACDGDLRAGVRSRGVEVEVFSRPIENVNFNLGVTYSDTKYRNNLVGAGGRGLTNALFQLPGRRVSNSSQWTLTSSFAWTPPIGNSGLSGLFYVDARHQSKLNTGSDLDIEKIENGYTVVNGRVGIRGPDNNWGVELWAQNLFNEDFKQIAFDALLQGSGTQRGVEQGFYTRSTQLFGVFLGEPRTYGVTLRGNIGFARPAPAAYVAPPAPPPPPAPATQTCPDGTVILATDTCPAAPPPPPPPSGGERGN